MVTRYLIKQIIELMLQSSMQAISQKFTLRKENIIRAQILGRKICWILKAVGMFKLRAKKAKVTVAHRTIFRYVLVSIVSNLLSLYY